MQSSVPTRDRAIHQRASAWRVGGGDGMLLPVRERSASVPIAAVLLVGRASTADDPKCQSLLKAMAKLASDLLKAESQDTLPSDSGKLDDALAKGRFPRMLSLSRRPTGPRPAA
jgi:hypothetical protein